MKRLLLLLCMVNIYAMEQDQVPEPKPTEIKTPERQKEKEDKKKEMARGLLRSSMQIPLMYPHACKPKEIYYPDLKEKDGQ